LICVRSQAPAADAIISVQPVPLSALMLSSQINNSRFHDQKRSG
jgi:hypothetical protein